MSDHGHHDEQEELRQIREVRALLTREFREFLDLLRIEGRVIAGQARLIQAEAQDIHEILVELKQLRPRLTTIRINFGGTMADTVTLKVGQKTKATVLGFDQNGQPFTGTMPAATFSIDSPSLDSIADDGAGGSDVTSLAEGPAVLSATLVTAEGASLSATGAITNTPATGPAQVLSSTKINFSDPV